MEPFNSGWMSVMSTIPQAHNIATGPKLSGRDPRKLDAPSLHALQPTSLEQEHQELPFSTPANIVPLAMSSDSLPKTSRNKQPWQFHQLDNTKRRHQLTFSTPLSSSTSMTDPMTQEPILDERIAARLVRLHTTPLSSREKRQAARFSPPSSAIELTIFLSLTGR